MSAGRPQQLLVKVMPQALLPLLQPISRRLLLLLPLLTLLLAKRRATRSGRPRCKCGGGWA